mmetsp:Transcript_3528/g.7727  ORF Transcript_3528/g.7727 Transcript_3528/m.7727 type:complete len:101 (+) Transcript_3528:12-314(+)
MCELCGLEVANEFAADFLHIMDNCNHRICQQCALIWILSGNAEGNTDFICPLPRCNTAVSAETMSKLLADAEISQFINIPSDEYKFPSNPRWSPCFSPIQ